MARPLREQFLLGTLILLIPIGVVITWAYETTYSEQLEQLKDDAHALAAAVAAHIADQSGPEAGPRITEYLRTLEMPPGSKIVVAGPGRKPVAEHQNASTNVEELRFATASTPNQAWTVTAGLPTSVAQERAARIYRRTTLISGIATLVLLAMEFVFLRRWLPSLKYLERSADRVGTGDLGTLVPQPMPSRELEHVRDAFGDMIEKLRDAREAIGLQMEEERRMREEVESLQRQVIRQERLAAIGVLLSGIAHELNNPLQAISGSAEILQRDPTVREDMRADLALIHKESARASGIIRNLSRFSRQHGLKPSAVIAKDLIASVVELRQRRLHDQQIALVVEDLASHGIMAVFPDLQQVLLNFVVNAEQAIIAANPDERRIVIRACDRESLVRVEVEDTGPGVPQGDESKLFQPFFTTKPVGEGTGLGLSVSYGIIRSFGGTMGYRRGNTGGALFFFELPAAAA